MNDTIYRQDAIDAVERNACNTQRSIEAIEALPSAQPDLILCKDCEYLDIQGTYAECGKGILGIVNRDDFCSRAERREE